MAAALSALAAAVRTGRQREFAGLGWNRDCVPDPQDPWTFERARLDWAELSKDGHAGLLAWYRRLIGLRRQVAALTDPRLDQCETQYDEAGRLILRRGPVVVASNLGTGTWVLPVGPRTELLAASDPRVKPVRRGVVLPPETVAVLTEQARP